MKTKEYYIELIIRRVLHYNDYWGDNIPDSELTNNTEEAIQTLREYCTLLSKNKKCVKNDFENNPLSVKEIVKDILHIIWGDNEIVRFKPHDTDNIINECTPHLCWKDKDGIPHHVHTSDNGYLYIENDPAGQSALLLYELDELEKIIISEKKTSDFADYLHKWYYFSGYEEGSDYIYISQINFKDNKFVFTGGRVKLTTENNFGDGVLICDVEDYSFGHLQYSYDCKICDELKKLLDSKEQVSFIDIKDTIVYSLDNYWFSDKDFVYDMKHHNK